MANDKTAYDFLFTFISNDGFVSLSFRNSDDVFLISGTFVPLNGHNKPE